MKAVLEIEKNDLNVHLIEILNAFFQQDVTEILIRKNAVKFEEFVGKDRITFKLPTQICELGIRNFNTFAKPGLT